VLDTLRSELADQFGIDHVTLQLEGESDIGCPQEKTDAL